MKDPDSKSQRISDLLDMDSNDYITRYDES